MLLMFRVQIIGLRLLHLVICTHLCVGVQHFSVIIWVVMSQSKKLEPIRAEVIAFLWLVYLGKKFFTGK